MQAIRWMILAIMLLPGAAMARPVLVVPVERDAAGKPLLWEDGNVWRRSLELKIGTAEDPKIILPMGDLEDVQGTPAEKIAQGSDEGLQVLAAKYRAGAVVVVEARYLNGQLTVQMGDERKHYSGDKSAAMQQAAEELLKIIEENPPHMPKTQQQTDPTAEQVLEAVLPIDSMVDWVQVKGKLAKVKALKRVTPKEITNAFVRLEMAHEGDVESVKTALALEGITLKQQNNDWVLKR